MKKNVIAGLDLGTTKVCAVIAEHVDSNINILGFGVAPSEGLTRGLVANIAKTADAINEAMNIAINRAGFSIKELNVGVAGEHITSLRHRNYVTINNPDHEISQPDLDRLRNDVYTIRIPSDREILHIIPEEYFVDHTGGIDDPIGMCGSRLEAVNHVVLASIPALANIKKSVERAGYIPKDLVLQPIASSLSVLEDNEKDLGVVLIDIGGGTTDVAVFHRKAIKHRKVIGVAGSQVTNDVRETLGIVTAEAEKLKREHGFATEHAIVRDEDIYIKGVGARGNVKIPVSLLTQIISVRMKELFTLIDNDLRNSGMKNKIKAGVVLTGGGSLLTGCDELASEIFGMPARIGVPLDLGGGLSKEVESPEFATVAGLVRGIPGKTSQESYAKASREGKFKAQKVFKRLTDFFENL